MMHSRFVIFFILDLCGGHMERLFIDWFTDRLTYKKIVKHFANKVSLLCLIIVSLGFNAGFANSQTFDSRGTEFWLTFNRNHTGSIFTPSLFVSASVVTNVTVEIPFLEYSEVLTLEPDIAQRLELPVAVELLENDTVTNEGIRVTSDQEVSVYGLSRLEFTTDAYLGLPVDVLGNEYVVSAWGSTLAGPSQYSIVATEDGTEIFLTPTLAEQECFPETQLTMNRGETYFHEGCNGFDTSGTVISSSAPVAVFGGHQCANIPDNNTTFCDHLIEQIPPVQSWGTQFITAPLATRTGGDTFRIIASEDATEVFINGESVAVLSRAEIYETLLVNASSVTASAPILLVQFSNGTSFDQVTSDPFKMIIPPFEQFLNNYTFSIPTEGFAANFVNIVVDQNQASLLELDGEPIALENFQSVTGTDFVFTQQAIDLGSHNLSGAVAGIFTYGFNEADSYGYPGGLSLSQVASVDAVDLLTDTLRVMADGMACASAMVADREQLPLEDIRVDFEITITLETANGSVRTDEQGIAEFCVEADPNGDFESATVRVSVGGFSDEASVDVVIARILAGIDLLADEISAAVGSEVEIPVMLLDQDGMPLPGTTVIYTLEINGEVITGSAMSGEDGIATLAFTASEALDLAMFALSLSAENFQAQEQVALQFTEGTEIDGEIVSGAGSSGGFIAVLHFFMPNGKLNVNTFCTFYIQC